MSTKKVTKEPSREERPKVENVTYNTTKCYFWSDCFSCPYPKCKDDVPWKVFLKWVKAFRAGEKAPTN